MQLRHDHALGTVNDKGTVVCHQGHFAHVDFLFFNVFDGFGRRFFIINNQTNLDAQRCRVGHTTQHTLFFIKGRGTEAIAHVLQSRIPGITYNWEDRFKCSMKTNIDTVLSECPLLQEFAIGVDLNGQQVWHIHDTR